MTVERESEAGVLAVKFSARPRIDGDKSIALLHGREDTSFDRAGVLKVRMGGSRAILAEAAALLAGLGQFNNMNEMVHHLIIDAAGD